MTHQEKQMEIAIQELKRANEKYDKLYREFCMMKLYADDLESQIVSLNSPDNEVDLGDMALESEIAMKKYTNKLKKENEKNRRKNAKC